MRFDAAGVFVGSGVVRAAITLDETGDNYTSTATNDVLDVNGNVISSWWCHQCLDPLQRGIKAMAGLRMRDKWSGSRQLAVEAVGNLIAFCFSFLTMFPFIPPRSSTSEIGNRQELYFPSTVNANNTLPGWPTIRP